jgi:hypothetical protein
VHRLWWRTQTLCEVHRETTGGLIKSEFTRDGPKSQRFRVSSPEG